MYPLSFMQGIAFEDVVMKVLTAGGPIANATMAGHVRLHDDKVRAECSHWHA